MSGILDENRAGFAAYIREQRCARGYSLREAAKRLGISAPWLSRLETAGPARLTSAALLKSFADLYGIPVAEVLDRAGYRVDPAELAAAESTPRGLRPQWAVLVEATDNDPAAAINALIASGGRVLALAPLTASSARTDRVLVLLEKLP